MFETILKRTGNQFTEKLDAAGAKEALPLIGLFILDLVVVAVATEVVAELSNKLL